MTVNVAFFGHGPDHPATRYRVRAYLPWLEDHGIRGDLHETPVSYPAWRRWVKDHRDIQVAVFQKKRVSGMRLRHLRKAGVRIVYDVDDAVMFASSRHATQSSARREGAFVRMVRRVDAVMAGNRYLMGLVAPHNPNCHWLPTVIDTSLYVPRPAPTPEVRELSLGWIGGRKSLPFLQDLAPVFTRLAGRFPNLSLRIVCNEFPDFEGIRTLARPWSEATETQEVAAFDVGLAPLPDDPWARGKCATKLLQGMAAAVPMVASPVGAHLEIVRENENGFLAATHDAWEEKLARLLADAHLRAEIGAAGRRTVEETYSLEVHVPRLAAILKEAPS